MIGIIESRKLPVVIVANKIDLPDAAPQRIKSAFPQHPVVTVSGLDGNNMDDLYAKIAEIFR
jgi:signal recognition particle receptor subunit beta